jgi:hypothetical protein
MSSGSGAVHKETGKDLFKNPENPKIQWILIQTEKRE